MTFEDFSWNYCLDSTYDFTKHKYVWCIIKNESCKKSTCPKIKEYHKLLKIIKYEEMLNDSEEIKKFQKEHGLIVDGIAGPKTMIEIEKELLNENIY